MWGRWGNRRKWSAAMAIMAAAGTLLAPLSPPLALVAAACSTDNAAGTACCCGCCREQEIQRAPSCCHKPPVPRCACRSQPSDSTPAVPPAGTEASKRDTLAAGTFTVALPAAGATLLGLLSTPATRLTGTIASGVRQVVNVVKAYADKEAAPAEAAPASA